VWSTANGNSDKLKKKKRDAKENQGMGGNDETVNGRTWWKRGKKTERSSQSRPSKGRTLGGGDRLADGNRFSQIQQQKKKVRGREER